MGEKNKWTTNKKKRGNRKQLVNGDFGRGQNQQLVIQAMLQKVKSINSVNQFTNVFNTVSID